MFPNKNSLIENHLRTAVGENKPIADVLQILTPQYLPDLKYNLISTMLNQSIVFFDDMSEINGWIAQMSTAECKQFQVSIIEGIGPFWASCILKKHSVWFNELNDRVTERLTRAARK